MPMIRETIVTTLDAQGTPHIAPLGLIQADDDWIIAPFTPSRTLENLRATGHAVASLTDDVRVFAGCLTGRKDWPLVTLEGFPGARLESALAHHELTVASVEEDARRPRFRCHVDRTVTHAPYLGVNRAQAAVVEAAILASRLQMLSREKIEHELQYLTIAIEKTAGPVEQEAWGWLMEKINGHLAADATHAGS